MQRETITINLPVSKVDVILNKNLVGRERRQLANIYLDSGFEIDVSGKMGTITSKISDAAQDLMWKIVIVSIAGKADNIVEDVLNLHGDDYDFLVARVNEITKTKPIGDEKKKS